MDCIILEWKPLRVEPENLPLDIVYEDENVLVVNKPAQMVITL
jgi:23S rRNA-/tRNA-specific pseudouridylate synthase